ncbi:DUF2628 domain-containing protein [Lacrimispora defluvii]|uniref:DUF2628 domain-containing protein n=1 Tax=Lacrimispora defluvii TaxID=2719233 RepID=A0ABX1VXE1_9FIRM|nr:DUF2628 domain-containing protein [Lacrimispora defluvii]NNJ31066.1 DUF2628 domain-containing protein [Lacrimispora defluvii]
MTEEQRNAYERKAELFVGENYVYYEKQWRGRMIQQNFSSWNWAAFFFPLYWLVYRKMYFEGFVFGVISLFGMIFPGIGLILHILVGIYANSYYRKMELRVLAQTSQLTEWEATQYIKKHGGTNVLGIFIALIIEVILASVFIGIAFISSVKNEINPQFVQSKTFTTDNFSFTFPSEWKQDTDATYLDLNCYSDNEQLLTGVLDYDKADFADNISPEDALTLYINKLQTHCDNFQFIENLKDETVENRRIKTVLYSGDTDGYKYYYAVSLAEFKDFEKFAIIVESALPSQYKKHKSTFIDIVDSCQPVQ